MFTIDYTTISKPCYQNLCQGHFILEYYNCTQFDNIFKQCEKVVQSVIPSVRIRKSSNYFYSSVLYYFPFGLEFHEQYPEYSKRIQLTNNASLYNYSLNNDPLFLSNIKERVQYFVNNIDKYKKNIVKFCKWIEKVNFFIDEDVWQQCKCN